ncbi:MAG TPA: hypothetical protein PKD51_06170 [Saprospiraceae bacterium]|nr:hypothetical protein [Saprospiraceae bacterium]
MNVAKYLSFCFVIMTLLYACETTKVAQKSEIEVSDDLILKLIDSIDFSSLRMDATGDGLFGRKIIYRDKSAAKKSVRVRGRIKLKVCINRDGIVKYAEVLQDSSTVKDMKALKTYLKAAVGYKFQPSTDVPEYECGSMSFKMDYWVNPNYR